MHGHTKPQTLSFSLVQIMNTNTHAHAVIINPGGVRIAFVRSHLILIVGSHLAILQQRRPFFHLIKHAGVMLVQCVILDRMLTFWKQKRCDVTKQHMDQRVSCPIRLHYYLQA